MPRKSKSAGKASRDRRHRLNKSVSHEQWLFSLLALVLFVLLVILCLWFAMENVTQPIMQLE
ncbi:hypothetical protein [Paenibacillus aquistagni]|uniref:hypothetical protein n=1 Tax=Paenibacillus aquistagni TaxID=1852522 RepID=UPI00145BABF6|nr:hypothetical protein [Paenibacillus aquistagni]NMM51572.1 hypothetical protein [Paenibacillus aquistagni]